MIEVGVRIVISLGVVLVLMWALAKVVRRPLNGRGAGAVAVLARQPLTRGASVAVVRVGERAYVLGVTDQSVSLLAEAEPDAIEAAAHPGHEVREKVPLEALGDREGRLTGSVLSPSTWRLAAAALRGGRRS
jgi:flagellar protein FliO/FliZ